MTTDTANPTVALSPSGTTVGPFATTFPYSDSTQLAVVILDPDGLPTALTLGEDFTVSALGGDSLANGGEVTLEAGSVPEDGWGTGDTQYQLTMERLTVADQLTDFPNAEGFQPEDTEDALDKLTRIVQELRAGLLRSIKVNIGETAPSVSELIQNIINQIINELEGDDVDQVVIDAVLANLTTIINAAAAELQAIIDAMEAAALALVPIVYAVDAGAANSIDLTLDPASVEADMAQGFTVIVEVIADNTGATVIGIDGFGPFDVVYASGEALEAGALKAGGSYLLAMNADDDFMVVGMNAPVAIEAGDVDFGATYTWNDITVIEWPAVGGYRFVECIGTVAIGTDTESEITLPVTYATSTRRWITTGQDGGVARSGIGVAGVRSYFSANNKIKLTNDNTACNVTFRTGGKVAA